MKNRRVHIRGRAFRVFIDEDYYFIDQAIQTLTISLEVQIRTSQMAARIFTLSLFVPRLNICDICVLVCPTL